MDTKKRIIKAYNKHFFLYTKKMLNLVEEAIEADLPFLHPVITTKITFYYFK
jgi:hypothetical protein